MYLLKPEQVFWQFVIMQLYMQILNLAYSDLVFEFHRDLCGVVVHHFA